jgi:hypothetical protein
MIEIEADHGEPRLRERGRQRQADVAQPEDSRARGPCGSYERVEYRGTREQSWVRHLILERLQPYIA